MQPLRFPVGRWVTFSRAAAALFAVVEVGTYGLRTPIGIRAPPEDQLSRDRARTTHTWG